VYWVQRSPYRPVFWEVRPTKVTVPGRGFGRQINQGSTKKHKTVFRDPNETRDFCSWYKKTVMSKKKVFDARNLKNCLPNLPLETGRVKKNIKLFQTIWCFPIKADKSHHTGPGFKKGF
jgi:hypothetical protein